MEIYRQGEYIRTVRLQLGMTQEQLAENIMERSNLSKVENGIQAISKSKFEALMQKMGHNPNSIPLFLLDGKSEKIHTLKDQIDMHLTSLQAFEADALIEELEKLLEFNDDALEQQYLLLAKTASSFVKKQLTSQTLDILKKALELGNAKFEEKDIPKYNLTAQDIRGINLLAIYYKQNNQLKKAIKVLELLEKNLSRRLIDKEEKGKRYPIVVYNLSNYLIEANNFYKALHYSELGLNVCKNSSNFFFSPHLTMNKIRCLYEVDDIENCKMLIKEVYYMFKHYQLVEQSEGVKQYAEEKLNLLLD